MREDGSWVRIYPIPFRRLDYPNRFQKYQWIEIDLERNHTKDHRPESHRISNLESLRLLDKIPTEKGGWNLRRRIVLRNVKKNMATLIFEAHNKNCPVSLATFKPTRILDVLVKSDSADWSPDLLAQFRQGQLFQESDDPFSVVEKIPWRFYFHFEDEQGRASKMMVEDWEIGALYRNCAKTCSTSREAAEMVRNHYLEMARTKDIFFYLGTTLRHHYSSRNPFLIIGVFAPPHVEPDLFQAT